MLVVEAINIFPIKGMRGIAVDSANLQQEGLEFDRRWMLVDTNGKFISQRSHPLLTQFIPELLDRVLKVRFESEYLIINLDAQTEVVLDVSVFDDKMKANTVSDKCDRWFSNILGENVKLVKVTDQTNRIKNFAKYLNKDQIDRPSTTAVGFADGYPYLILGTASMEHLNSKMTIPLSIDRFRPNIIVRTTNPHIEDSWTEFKIGSEQMMMVRPCARCQVPTVNQLTGEKGKQPNQALAKYRIKDNKVYFGMNAVTLSYGSISVGDQITF